MDSYIVRIYRRTGEPPELAGQVAKAGTEMKETFHNSAELVKVLMNGCKLYGKSGAGADVVTERTNLWRRYE